MKGFYRKHRYSIFKGANVLAIVAVLVAFSSFAEAAAAHDEEVEAQILEAERAASRGPYAADGVFTGSAQGYGGPVAMRVTIDNGYIDRVEIADAGMEDDAWLEMCLGLPSEIEKAQSTNVDTVSGATFTSSGILNGTAAALQKSLDGEAGEA